MEHNFTENIAYGKFFLGLTGKQVVISVSPCHHCMARTHAADGGSASVLNNSRGQPTMGDRPALGLGNMLTTPHRKKKNWRVTKF